MTVSPGFTAEEIAGFVREYEAVPFGGKGEWLVQHGFSRDQFRRWRAAYLEGDLERGLVPRQHATRRSVVARAKEAEERLVRVEAAHQREVSRLQEAHGVELARRDAQIAMLEAGTVTLGKAIGLLQKLESQEPVSVETAWGRSIFES